ncbi:MAG: hypothetical protein RR292_04665 [Christensenellaceae bacterium]
MYEIDLDTIKDILSKSSLSIDDMKNGPTCVMIDKKQFSIFVENDKLVVKQVKKLFAKGHKFDLSELA